MKDLENKACERCGYIQGIEKHHIIHRIEGGNDEPSNLRWLCRHCHDYQHAKDAVLKALETERKRLMILEKRLELIESLNTPGGIIKTGYQSYFNNMNDLLPQMPICGRK